MEADKSRETDSNKTRAPRQNKIVLSLNVGVQHSNIQTNYTFGGNLNCTFNELHFV
jgi:hypothetical protein